MKKRYYIVQAKAGILGTVGTQNRIGDDLLFDERDVADTVLGAIQAAHGDDKTVIYWVDWEWEENEIDLKNLKHGDKITLTEYHEKDGLCDFSLECYKKENKALTNKIT